MSEVTQQDWADTLACKIRERSVRVGVIGLGYVGLSLAVEFAKSGLQVTGIEIDADKVARLRSGESYVQDVKPYEVKGLIADEKLLVVNDFDRLSELDAVSICVPTPLSKTKGSRHFLYRRCNEGDCYAPSSRSADRA